MCTHINTHMCIYIHKYIHSIRHWETARVSRSESWPDNLLCASSPFCTSPSSVFSPIRWVARSLPHLAVWELTELMQVKGSDQSLAHSVPPVFIMMKMSICRHSQTLWGSPLDLQIPTEAQVQKLNVNTGTEGAQTHVKLFCNKSALKA